MLKVAPPVALPVLMPATGTWGRGKDVAEVGVAACCDVVVVVGGAGCAAVRRPWEVGGGLIRPVEVGRALRRLAGGGGAGFLAFAAGGGGSRVVTVIWTSSGFYKGHVHRDK